MSLQCHAVPHWMWDSICSNNDWKHFQTSSTTHRSQWKSNPTSIHRHQTPPRYRHAAHGRHCTMQSASLPLRPNVTSSIKPELHNVAQRRQRTKPRPQGIGAQNFVQIGPSVHSRDMLADRQTDRRVDHNTPHSYQGGVISLRRTATVLTIEPHCSRWIEQKTDLHCGLQRRWRTTWHSASALHGSSPWTWPSHPR